MEKEKEYLKQKKTRITITKTETIPTQMSNDKVVEVKVDSKDKNDIVKNNEGIYQYELARFRTTANGITDLQDMRTFLDFNSIYSAIQTEYRAKLSELEQELASVEDGSAYLLKSGGTINGDL